MRGYCRKTLCLSALQSVSHFYDQVTNERDTRAYIETRVMDPSSPRAARSAPTLDILSIEARDLCPGLRTGHLGQSLLSKPLRG